MAALSDRPGNCVSILSRKLAKSI